jgi:MFS family permease
MSDELNLPMPKTELYWVFGALMLGMLLAALDSTIVATALPTIVGDLHGANHLSWVVVAYLLATTVSTPLWGKLGDLHGRKMYFQAAIVIFLIGSMLCGAAHSMAELILFRALQGLGGGGLMVGAQAIIADLVPPRERGRYAGFFGARTVARWRDCRILVVALDIFRQCAIRHLGVSGLCRETTRVGPTRVARY